jgi:hypothetical protein
MCLEITNAIEKEYWEAIDMGLIYADRRYINCLVLTFGTDANTLTKKLWCNSKVYPELYIKYTSWELNQLFNNKISDNFYDISLLIHYAQKYNNTKALEMLYSHDKR